MIVHVQYVSYLVWGCLSVHLWQTRQGNGAVSPGILAGKVGLGCYSVCVLSGLVSKLLYLKKYNKLWSHEGKPKQVLELSACMCLPQHERIRFGFSLLSARIGGY